jgi:4-amino-4-deoxy-L-arabinose transferase-like glycosyltransferase
LQRRSGRAAGAGGSQPAPSVGFGIYVYNGHLLLLPLIVLFVCLAVARRRGRLLPRGAVCVAVAAIVVLPMARLADNPHNGYFNHAHAVSVFRQPEWNALDSTGDRPQFLLSRYGGF